MPGIRESGDGNFLPALASGHWMKRPDVPEDEGAEEARADERKRVVTRSLRRILTLRKRRSELQRATDLSWFQFQTLHVRAPPGTRGTVHA